MAETIRRIGILTSGGDAPGMNAAIRAAVRTCAQNGVTPIGIHRGYNGLIHSDVVEMDARSVNGITSKGGTTYAALTSMEEDHLKTRFMKALDMARARAVELGDEFGKA